MSAGYRLRLLRTAPRVSYRLTCGDEWIGNVVKGKNSPWWAMSAITNRTYPADTRAHAANIVFSIANAQRAKGDAT